MPRYFFHLEGRGERVADRRGQILPDEAAALREANLVAAALRTYRGEAWRVILTKRMGARSQSTPNPVRGERLGRNRIRRVNVDGAVGPSGGL